MSTQLPSTSRPANFRRRLLFLAALIVFIGVPAYLEFKLRRPVGEGPAGPRISIEPFESAWTERRVHLLGIGDSVTRGLGANSKSHSYFERLRQNPKDEWPDMRGKHLSAVLPNLSVSNVAVSGSTSLDHERIIETEIEPFDADVFDSLDEGTPELSHRNASALTSLGRWHSSQSEIDARLVGIPSQSNLAWTD
ncbi:SGNH/GDSL hydrolase family protein [Rhodopirellula sp. P2]|uniref:SGNH/GDSL hydrolase family protein n=1 Tax=Rhodopirellula sp. P2 TaxID=2127060 RepID=UPI00236877A6|nr:SGNH/GDSL hydrolase family protein [Rhodopirellula sp. P2]WDQ14739.1 SGNH/GDSL hydrolase family protein [Rhodopirellula sp. P2]